MREIDIQTWPRKNAYTYFSSYQQPHFNVCGNVTITRTLSFLAEKENHLSKFTAMLWFVSNVANTIPEFRCRVRNETIIEHQRVHPSFAWLNGDKTITFCMAEYTPDILMFFENVQKSTGRVEPNPIVVEEQCADNVLYVSCLPWINFTSVTHPIRLDDTASIPRIAWGKFTKSGEQWTMPVSLQLHHGFADGYHAGLFFERLQHILDHPETFNWPL